MRHRKALHLVTALAFFISSSLASAEDLTSGFTRAEDVVGSGNVFVSGAKPGAVLMKIDLWGAVHKSGIHYVPPQTDFVTLLSYAGGPISEADLKHAYIKRRTKNQEKIINVNIRDLLSVSSKSNPHLQPNDIVVVPQIEPTVSNNTVLTVTFVSSVLSIVLAAVVIKNELK